MNVKNQPLLRVALGSLMNAAALLALVAASAATGCSISGHYGNSGPCKGFHTNPQACRRAAENSRAVARVRVGQAIDEVSTIMGKGPERREATADTETWSYLTDYDAELMTTIVFRQGVVSEIKQTPWVPEQKEPTSTLPNRPLQPTSGAKVELE